MVFQVLPGVSCYVPADLQGLEVIKVCAAQLPETPGRRPVTLPRLRLQQEVLAEGGQSGEQRQEAGISVVEVDPHGDRQAEAQVEAGAAVLLEVAPQRLGVPDGVHGDEGDAAARRDKPLRPLDEELIQVKAQQVNLPLLFAPHHMLVKSFAQLLGIK